MRLVLKSTDEALHFWANQVQESGRSGDVFFEGDKVFSYGHHFCMARHLPWGVVAMTTRSYSPTTSRHVYNARRAVAHHSVVYCNDPSANVWDNRNAALRELARLLAGAEKPRIRQTTRDRLRNEAYHVAACFNAYLEALPRGEKEAATREPAQPFDLATLGGYRATYETERRIANERRLERGREALAQWRNRESYSMLLRELPPALRLSADGRDIETSHGADVPVSAFEPVWTLVQNVRASGRDLELRNARRVGNYMLTLVRADGSIVVGCHDIPASELAMMAATLGHSSAV